MQPRARSHNCALIWLREALFLLRDVHFLENIKD
jgi:hypothetical protein